MNAAERQLDQLHDFLAQHKRPAGVTVSDFVQREAESGNLAAKAVMGSGLFNGASSPTPAPAPAPIMSAHMQNREHRLATQQLPKTRKLNTREPCRPIVHSGAVRDWMTK